MSSGRGLSGGVSRCYPFFAEFKECLVSAAVSYVMMAPCLFFVAATALKKNNTWCHRLVLFLMVEGGMCIYIN